MDCLVSLAAVVLFCRLLLPRRLLPKGMMSSRPASQAARFNTSRVTNRQLIRTAAFLTVCLALRASYLTHEDNMVEEERDGSRVENNKVDGPMGCATAPARKEQPELETAKRISGEACATTNALQLSSMGAISFTDYYAEAVRLAPEDYLGRWLDYGRLRRMLARGKELREQHAATPFCVCELLPEECVCVRPPDDQPGRPQFPADPPRGTDRTLQRQCAERLGRVL